MAEQDTLALIKAALMSVEPNRAAQFEDLRLETTIDDLELDSIALMEMIGYLEDQLDTTFPDEEMAQIERLADLAVLIGKAS
jgi:acyl carrier protein